jgi:hypothetical protein
VISHSRFVGLLEHEQRLPQVLAGRDVPHQSGCSLRVRTKRSMQPFPSGWRTKILKSRDTHVDDEDTQRLKRVVAEQAAATSC